MRYFIIFFIYILFSNEIYAQKFNKDYEKGFKFYKKKEYNKAIEICSKLLENKDHSTNEDDLWYVHSSAFILHYIYRDTATTFYDPVKSKSNLDLSKLLLDKFIQLRPDLMNKLKVRYEYIQEASNQIIEKAPVNSSITKNQKSGEIVELVVSGDGVTREQAIQNALRHAIEQVFGSFITTRSTIVNDSLFNDEFVSISSGNIISYNVISETKENNLYKVVVSSTVSPENIMLSVAAKTGKEFELSGGTYYQNILKEEFYKKQELTVLQNFYDQWHYIELFNYEVQELEMFRYVAKTIGEFWMPCYSTYRNYYHWEFNKKDLKFYNNQELLTILNTDIDEGEKSKWSYLPKEYVGMELFQIPYKIKVSPNDNYYKFIKSYVELLNILSIKDVENYKAKYGDPIIFWEFVYSNLSAAIQAHKPYLNPMQYSPYDGHIALRNYKSIEILDQINSIVCQQEDCANLYIEGIKNLTFPPAYELHNVIKRDEYGNSIFRFCRAKTENVDNFELPYPAQGRDFNGEVYVLLSFTKEELSKLNKKISFNFSLNKFE